MKKTIKTILSLIILILCLTSCDSVNDSIYKSFVCDSVNDGIGASAEVDFWNGLYFKKQNMSDKTYVINGKSYTASYRESVVDKMNSYTTDIYIDENKIEFGLRHDTGELALFNLMNAEFFNSEPYLPEVNNPLDTAKRIATKIASEYVDDISEYTQIIEEPRVYYKEKDGIKYEISYYIITFAKKVNGYFSSDYISVKVTSKGNLASIKIGDINAFKNIHLEFDIKVMNQSILDKIDYTYAKSIFKVKESSVRDQKIVLTPNGNVCMRTEMEVVGTDTSNIERRTSLVILTVLGNKK